MLRIMGSGSTHLFFYGRLGYEPSRSSVLDGVLLSLHLLKARLLLIRRSLLQPVQRGVASSQIRHKLCMAPLLHNAPVLHNCMRGQLHKESIDLDLTNLLSLEHT